MRHIFLLFLVPAVLFLSSCSMNIQIGKGDSHRFRHVVVAWLKDKGNSAHRKELITAGKALREIPGVISIEMGQCVPSPRPIVDSTYDVAYIMTFRDEASMKSYVSHPKHQEAVAKTLKPLTKKIAVYDFVDE